MSLVNCSECSHKISDKAVSCPNCGLAIASQNIAVKEIDPFSNLHSSIKGKSKGELTILGKISLYFLGPFMLFGSILTIKQSDSSGLLLFGVGTAFMIASYLWARR